MNKGGKVGGGGTQRVRRGKGGGREKGVHSLTIWIYCFKNGGEGWKAGGGEKKEGSWGVKPSLSLVNSDRFSSKLFSIHHQGTIR